MNKDTTLLSTTLSIRISTDGFCFCTYDSQQPESVRYNYYECDSSLTLALNFDEAWKGSGLAGMQFNTVQVIVATTEFTTVPGEYDRKEDYEQLFGSCFDIRDRRLKVLANKMSAQDMAVLFAVDEELYRRVCEIGNVSFYSTASILLGFLARYPRSEERYMLACYHGTNSYLIAMEGERPVLMNSFGAENIDDQLFYLLSILSELGQSQETDALLLCGDRSADAVHMAVSRFVRNVERVNPRELFRSNLLNKIENIPFDLQALILCE
jgi:hypothetical protein